MTSDANKGISAIFYNHLNLPESIRIAGKGTIKYVYDASGNKLKKKEFSGVFFQKDKVTSTYEKDGVQHEIHSYSEGVNFEFNDAAVDVQAFKNGKITNVAVTTDALVNGEMEKSGVQSQRKDLVMQKRILQQEVKWIMGCNLLKSTFYSGMAWCDKKLYWDREEQSGNAETKYNVF